MTLGGQAFDVMPGDVRRKAPKSAIAMKLGIGTHFRPTLLGVARAGSRILSVRFGADSAMTPSWLPWVGTFTRVTAPEAA